MGAVVLCTAVYLLNYFVVASYLSTIHGEMRWDLGWEKTYEAFIPD